MVYEGNFYKNSLKGIVRNETMFISIFFVLICGL